LFSLDHTIDNLILAKSLYHNINFNFINLNIINSNIFEKFDFITCFETLEHVGSINNALQNLVSLRTNSNTPIIISVPIEVGLIGIFKFLFKIFKGYKLSELKGNPSKVQYLISLLKGDISKYRDVKEGWGTHFGFDYNEIDHILMSQNINFTTRNYFTTRFYIIN
jgi:hypothetical protein